MRIHSRQHAAEAPAERAPIPQPQRAGSGLNILLAEDNKINQRFATALLTKAGHRVTVAENGHQAVDAARHSDFDVILMDIQMPDLDGIGAAREIRELPAPKNRVPIIAHTAHAMSGARAEYLAAGMDDYVTKPVRPEILLAKLAAIAGRLSQTEPGEPAAAPNTATTHCPSSTPNKLASLTDSLSLEMVRNFLELSCPTRLAISRLSGRTRGRS